MNIFKLLYKAEDDSIILADILSSKKIYSFNEDEIKKRYNSLIKNNVFWEYCKSSTYIDNFEKAKEVYLSRYDEANDKDFIDNEIEFYFKSTTYYIFDELKEDIKLSKLRELEFLEEQLSNFYNKKRLSIDEKCVENEIWHKVGVAFVKGDIKRCYEKTKSFRKVATILLKESDHPYISSSWNNLVEVDKNIFKDSKKIESILNFCEANNITICNSFTSRINQNQ